MSIELLQKHIPLKAYSLAALAVIYDVDPRTLKKWMAPFQNEIGPRIGRLYTIPQVKIIFSRLDLPGQIILTF